MEEHLRAGTGHGRAVTCWRGGGTLGAPWCGAAGALDAHDRVPWFGPPMGALSFVSARLMETWAHGQDVADALGVTRVPTARLRHIAHLGVRARPFSYVVRGLEVPADAGARRADGPVGGALGVGRRTAAVRARRGFGARLLPGRDPTSSSWPTRR